MWKKVLVGGVVGAAILGAGGAALAATDGTSPSPSPTAKAAGTHQKHGKGGELRRAIHGQWTTKDKTGYVTHDAIRGTVTAVSPTSVAVKAADGTAETYAVTAQTVVHTKADGKGKGGTGQIGKVQDGDQVEVVGTGTTALTATHLVDRTR